MSQVFSKLFSFNCASIVCKPIQHSVISEVNQELICDFMIKLIKVSIQLKHVYNNIITKTLFLQNKNKSKVQTI